MNPYAACACWWPVPVAGTVFAWLSVIVSSVLPGISCCTAFALVATMVTVLAVAICLEVGMCLRNEEQAQVSSKQGELFNLKLPAEKLRVLGAVPRPESELRTEAA